MHFIFCVYKSCLCYLDIDINLLDTSSLHFSNPLQIYTLVVAFRQFRSTQERVSRWNIILYKTTVQCSAIYFCLFVSFIVFPLGLSFHLFTWNALVCVNAHGVAIYNPTDIGWNRKGEPKIGKFCLRSLSQAFSFCSFIVVWFASHFHERSLTHTYTEEDTIAL